jgi:hypothetical protein
VILRDEAALGRVERKDSLLFESSELVLERANAIQPVLGGIAIHPARIVR